MDTQRKIKPVYSRITEDLEVRLDVACAERRVKRPDAIEAAIRLWVTSGSVPESEQTLLCPACESTISIDPNGLTKVIEPGPVLKKEQKQPKHAPGVSYGQVHTLPEERKWIETLLFILRRGQPGTKQAVMTNLEQFQEITELVTGEARDEQDLADAGPEVTEQNQFIEELIRKARNLGRVTPPTRRSRDGVDKGRKRPAG